MKTYKLICEHCGKEFYHTNKIKRFCSIECKKTLLKTLVCPICGTTFTQNAPAQKYCSEECHLKAKNNMARERIIKKSREIFTGIDGIDYVECKICGQRMNQFHNEHLKLHNITLEEYEKKYGKLIRFPSKYVQEHYIGEHNTNHKSKTTLQERKERSPFSKEYYKKRGLTEEDRIKFHKAVAKNRSYNTQLDYYLNKGLSEEDAKRALSERQSGLGGGSHSKIATEFIKEVLGKEINNPQYLWGYNEFSLIHENENHKKRKYHYDLTNTKTKRIIEFNGDFWHGNPTLYEDDEINSVSQKSYKSLREYDNEKYDFALKNGYTVMVIWESDYHRNKEVLIENCQKFIL